MSDIRAPFFSELESYQQVRENAKSFIVTITTTNGRVTSTAIPIESYPTVVSEIEEALIAGSALYIWNRSSYSLVSVPAAKVVAVAYEFSYPTPEQQ